MRLHWFLPTSGDSRADIGLGSAVGATSRRVEGGGVPTPDRPPSLAYLGQVARAAEQSGFDAALTPTSSWCEDAWVVTSALAPLTERLRFLVAFRPGLISPTTLAQMAATYQRITGGRLLLNTVVGGDDVEQRRFGDHLGKDERYARAAEHLQVLRELWTGRRVDFTGRYLQVEDAQLPEPPAWPEVYLGGSSAAGIDVAARHADVYLTWGEPPEQVAGKIDQVRAAAAEVGRELRFGIRLHVITRDHADDAWAVADRLLAGLDPDQIERAQATQRASQSEGQKRMTALHGGRTDSLVISPNLWAGIGLVRGGAGTALVGSHAEVADRMEEYASLGISEFVLSGYPHLEEAYAVGEGLVPELDRRGLRDRPGSSRPTVVDAGRSRIPTAAG